jgi:alpha-ribazole phosphatase/probable phosphoglycerate mutase
MTTTIDLIRHGEPVGGRMYRGAIDHPLSERGWQQMRDATAEPEPWDYIVSSPLARCRAFAEELAGRLGLALTIDTRLQEVGFGVWEGKTGAELRAEDPQQLSRFYHDPVANRPEGAEQLDRFLARVGGCIDELVERQPGRHGLLVCHAGVMRAAVAHTLGAPLPAMYRLAVDNAALTRLQKTAERPLSLLFHNRPPASQ